MLKLKDLDATYGEGMVLRKVNLEALKGELLV